MTLLIDTLNKIMNWLEKNQPEYAASFLPGLKYKEIQAAEEKLGFKLPEEVYELYQWRNGTTGYDLVLESEFGTVLLFWPLDEVIYTSEIMNQESVLEESEYYSEQDNYLFFLVYPDDMAEAYVIPLDDKTHQVQPVLYFFDEDPCLELKYKNLTSLIVSIAKYYDI